MLLLYDSWCAASGADYESVSGILDHWNMSSLISTEQGTFLPPRLCSNIPVQEHIFTTAGNFY
jgi:hypothetical protein